MNPYYSVEKLISEPLEIFKTGNKNFRRSRSIELLELTGLTSRFLKRKPHELSGGQCQRVAIARALSTGPKLLICDEPFSGLDIPSRFDLMKLFARLSQESGLSYLMISHDFS